MHVPTVLIQVAESCRKAGSPEVEVLPFDLTNLSGIKGWAETLLSKHKEGLDVLVNNAGTLGPLTFDKVTVTSAYICTVAKALQPSATCPGVAMLDPIHVCCSS